MVFFMVFMIDNIKYRDFEKILKYAKIYGLANGREDILKQYGILRRIAEKCTPDSKVQIDEKNGELFGSLCLYAIASVGSTDDEAAREVCRIVREHSSLLAQYDRASALVIADLLKDPRKGDRCPFYQLYKYLEEGGCGAADPQSKK